MPYVGRMASVRTLRPPVEAAQGAQPPTAAEFPGCKPVRLPREELDHCEVRFEHWDTVSETAWICDPVSSYHEDPTRCLGRLAERIAAVRGAPVKCLSLIHI